MPVFEALKRVVHCDWGVSARKRATCIANRTSSGWRIDSIGNAGDPRSLLSRISENLATQDRVVIGFDFPIGYPESYGLQAALHGFLTALPMLGQGVWENFFNKAYEPHEVSIHRPFYPRHGNPQGFTSTDIHAAALGIRWKDLYRVCEKGTDYRNQASPLFWTLGPKAVGTAAICGWREVLQPLLAMPHREFGIWPFEGSLGSILQNRKGAVVETYPGEAYSHIGFPRFWTGKTSRLSRQGRAVDFHRWADKAEVTFSDAVTDEIENGFPQIDGQRSERDGEDPFDALVGLCSMMEVVRGAREEGRHPSPAAERHEGWIFGQQYSQLV